MFIALGRKTRPILLVTMLAGAVYLLLRRKHGASSVGTRRLGKRLVGANVVGPFITMSYQPEHYSNVKGRTFVLRRSHMVRLGLESPQYVDLTPEVAQDFVFVTAANRHFFQPLQSTIALIQKYRPQNVIYVYDLGLRKSQIRRTVLREHPGVLWLDTSVRLITGNFTDLLIQVQETGGALALTTTGHSTFAATNPSMFRYLPSGDYESLRREEQREATLLLYRTKPVMDNVVTWLVACALEPKCIAPSDAQRGCMWRSSDHFATYGNCHRFDQSAVNILLMNHIKGASSLRYYARTRVCKIERYVGDDSGIKICQESS